MGKSRLRPNHKTGECEECGKHQMRRHRFRGEWLCDACLLGDMEPIFLENYIYKPSMIDQAAERGESDHLGISTHSPFYRQLTKAMHREGWLKNQKEIKNSMFYRK